MSSEFKYTYISYIRKCFRYLDTWLFPEKRNGPTDLYEGRDFVIQENNLFQTRRKCNVKKRKEKQPKAKQ